MAMAGASMAEKVATTIRAFLPLAGAAWLCAVGLQIALYARPGPYGAPYVIDTAHYLPYALFYEGYGMALALLPCVALAWWRPDWTTRLRRIALIWLMLLLILGHVNHELQRFMGLRLSPAFFATYARAQGAPDALWRALAGEAGGAWLSVLLLAVPLLLFPWLVRRLELWHWCLPRLVSLAALTVYVIAPAISWHGPGGGRQRMNKVAPALLALMREGEAAWARTPISPAQLQAAAREENALWQAANGNPALAPATPEAPYARHCATPRRADHRPDIILIVLETFRATSMRRFNPASPDAPTPFLDALAGRPDSAWWSRHTTNGVPTVYAMLALQTGIPPHSRDSVATTYPQTRYDALPALLRSAGYRTAFFTGTDPDWDGQRFWLRRWYDSIAYDPADKEQDRRVFRNAAASLTAQAKAPRPLFALVQSISNHSPFHAPEARFHTAGALPPIRRIADTMRYTDDVVREFVEGLRRDPRLANAIIVVTGDHGYDLGERGEAGGLTNLRHETTWVPLIINSPRGLPVQGEQRTIGSHIDLMPTLLDLAGLCGDWSAAGHSLFSKRADAATAWSVKDGHIAYADMRFSLYLPEQGAPLLYRTEDWAQQKNVAQQFPQETERMSAQARARVRLNDALIEGDRVKAR